MELVQRSAEFAGADCPTCGDPLALDGACDSCADDFLDDYDLEDDDLLIDLDDDVDLEIGGEA